MLWKESYSLCKDFVIIVSRMTHSVVEFTVAASAIVVDAAKVVGAHVIFSIFINGLRGVRGVRIGVGAGG